MNRVDGRSPEQLREITFFPNIAPHASGSVLVSCGRTRVICSVMIERGVPRWMKEQKVKGGWLTAEYAMLPYSTIAANHVTSREGNSTGAVRRSCA